MKQSVLFLDCETTGLPRKRGVDPFSDVTNWPRLVQVAWLLTTAPEYAGPVSSRIVTPTDWEIPAEAAGVHGITTATALAKGRDLADVLAAIWPWVRRADAIVAYGAEFDRGVLTAELLREHGPKLARDLWTKPWEDVQAAARERLGFATQHGPSLDALHVALFGHLPVKQSHKADADVETLVRCYREMKHRGLLAA